MEHLTSTLLSLWKFPSFCASRWITVGTSCRTFVQGLLTGIGGLFTYMKDKGAITDFDAQPGLRVSDEVIQASVVAGLSAYVSESFSSLAMSDPRLLPQVDALEESVADELQFLERVQPFVWTTLASLSGSRGWVLRDQILRAATASAAHLHRRIFWELSFPPWSMFRIQDPHKVLAAIESLEEASPDPVIGRLQHLARIKFHRPSLVAAIQLLQSVSFSSHFTERQHSSTASLKKVHDYSSATLCPRAFVHTFRFRCLGAPHPPPPLGPFY